MIIKVIVRKTGLELMIFSAFFVALGIAIFCFFGLYDIDVWLRIPSDISILLSFVIILLQAGSLIGYGLYVFITELKKPKKIISYDKKTSELYLHPEGISLHLRNIEEIKYTKDPSIKGFSQEKQSGTLYIYTAIKIYEYKSVSLVEIAADRLENIVYDYKQGFKNNG